MISIEPLDPYTDIVKEEYAKKGQAVSDTTANIINPFKDKKFFFIQIEECLFSEYYEAYKDKNASYMMIPWINGIGEAKYIVYGDRNTWQLFSIMRLDKALPVPSDLGPEMLELMPRKYFMQDYNSMINFKTGKYILLKMNNLGSNALTRMFLNFMSKRQDMIGFDAEQFTQSK